jgi:hypothetical protein
MFSGIFIFAMKMHIVFATDYLNIRSNPQGDFAATSIKYDRNCSQFGHIALDLDAEDDTHLKCEKELLPVIKYLSLDRTWISIYKEDASTVAFIFEQLANLPKIRAKIETIDIKNSQIDFLKESYFTTFKNLKTLQLIDNKIKRMDCNTFMFIYSYKLENVLICDNKLSTNSSFSYMISPYPKCFLAKNNNFKLIKYEKLINGHKTQENTFNGGKTTKPQFDSSIQLE